MLQFRARHDIKFILYIENAVQKYYRQQLVCSFVCMVYLYLFRPGSRHFYNTTRLYSVWNLDPQWISVNLLVTQSFDTQQTDTDTDTQHKTQNNEHRKKVLLYLSAPIDCWYFVCENWMLLFGCFISYFWLVVFWLDFWLFVVGVCAACVCLLADRRTNAKWKQQKHVNSFTVTLTLFGRCMDAVCVLFVRNSGEIERGRCE